MRTVFLTGGSGFIGRHVADALLTKGCEVRCLVRSPSASPHLHRDGLRVVQGSLADASAWRPHLDGCDTVINVAGLVAGRNGTDLLETNGRGPAALADACAALQSPPRFVHVSSLAAAGPTPESLRLRTESDPPTPISRYGASKRAGEVELEKRSGRLPVTIIRPGIVFGPHDRGFAQVFQFVSTTRAHLQMGFREPPLSLIHVADLVDLVLAAAERGATLATDAPGDGRGVYNGCDDREHPTYGELGRRVGRALGLRRVVVLPLPAPVARPAVFVVEKFWNALGRSSLVSRDKLREATARSWAASAARSRDELGVAPRTSLDDRLRETADWLHSAGWL